MIQGYFFFILMLTQKTKPHSYSSSRNLKYNGVGILVRLKNFHFRFLSVIAQSIRTKMQTYLQFMTSMLQNSDPFIG